MWRGKYIWGKRMTTRREVVVNFFSGRVGKGQLAAGVCANCRRHKNCQIQAECVPADFKKFKSRDLNPIDATARMNETLQFLTPQ